MDNAFGLETSGNLCRSYPNGIWLTASSTGIFTGGQSIGLNGSTVQTNNNNTLIVRTLYGEQPLNAITVTYSLSTRSWSGGGVSLYQLNGPQAGFAVRTSGGLIGFGNSQSYGPYISLT